MTFSTTEMNTLKYAIKLTLNQGHNKYTLSKQDFLIFLYLLK